MNSDVREFALALFNRVNSLTLNPLCPKASQLKTLLDSRDNSAIIQHFKDKQKKGEDLADLEDLYHFAVLHLTCNNDPDTLEEVLRWGRTEGLQPQWKEEEDFQCSENPIMVASQQENAHCTRLLYQHGYRIPQVGGDGNVREGEQEQKRKEIVMAEPSSDNQVGKFLAMEAYSKPNYISLAFTEDKRIDQAEVSDADIKDLEKLDPLRRAFQLADWADDMQSMPCHLTNLTSNYAEIRDKMDAFARGVLTQCHNMDEVATILEHQPEPDNPSYDRPRQQNFMKALWEGRVEFVSHPYYQAYFEKRLTGSATMCMGTRYPLLWHLLYLPVALLLFLFYPLVVFLDFFKNADILFVKDEEKAQTSANGAMKTNAGAPTKSTRLFTFFRAQIHTPIFRMIVYCTIQLVYLILLVVMVWNPIEEKEDLEHEVHWFHYIVVIITGIFIIEEGLDFCLNLREKEKANFFESYWNIFSLCFRSILFVGMSVYLSVFFTGNKTAELKNKNSRADFGGNETINWSFTLIAIGVAGEFFKTLRFLLFFQCFGPLVICIINVIKDALKTIVVYLIVFSSYGIFMWAMFKPFQDNQGKGTNEKGTFTLATDSETSTKLFHTLFWRILNAENEEPVSIIKSNGTSDWVSYEFAHAVTMFTWGAYQITIAIVMVNLLIAIMNNTFTEVWQNADKNWKYSRTYYQAQFLPDKATFPSPFQWLYYLAVGVFNRKNRRREKKEREKKKYFQLLKKLILIMQHQEFEKSANERLNDLRKDLNLDLAKMREEIKIDSAKLWKEKTADILQIQKSLPSKT